MINEDSFKHEQKKDGLLKKFIYSVIIKTLIVIILFLLSMIFIKYSNNNKKTFKKIVYKNSLSFAKIYDIYNRYLGDIIPFKNIYKNNTKLVSEDKFSYNKVKKKNNGYVFETSSYSISSITSGIVVDVKKSEKYNNSITIQDKNGLIITYGYIKELNVKLYDYVSKGEMLGSIENKLYLEFMKDDKYLSYDKYL